MDRKEFDHAHGNSCSLSTNFGYQPVSYPDPPSALRQLSYVEGSGLIGPDGDPEGWKILEPVSIKGTLFDAREVQAKCLVGGLQFTKTFSIPYQEPCHSLLSPHR